MKQHTLSAFRPKTRKEVANELQISTKSLKRKLHQKEIKLPSGLIVPQDQKRIYDALWYPKKEVKNLLKDL